MCKIGTISDFEEVLFHSSNLNPQLCQICLNLFHFYSPLCYIFPSTHPSHFLLFPFYLISLVTQLHQVFYLTLCICVCYLLSFCFLAFFCLSLFFFICSLHSCFSLSCAVFPLRFISPSYLPCLFPFRLGHPPHLFFLFSLSFPLQLSLPALLTVFTQSPILHL